MTHGIWTKDELEIIKIGRDTNLITEFLNCKTFSENEIKIYPYHLRRTFICEWYHDTIESPDLPEVESDTIYATDKNALKVYLSKEYIRLPDYVAEKFTRVKEIKL